MALGAAPAPKPAAESADPAEDGADQAAYFRRVRPHDWVNPVPRDAYDLAVLGGGPAGLAAADTALQSGRSVALIERDRLGGDSLNYGSIPSKAIIGSARSHGGGGGCAAPAGDFAAAMTRMRRIRTRIAEYQSVDRLCARGVDIFFAEGRFGGRHELLAGSVPVRFRKALIATGAQPRTADIAGLAETGYLTSKTLLDLAVLPQYLVIIGGGPLGCEAAQAFARLGSKVTLVQNDPKFLPFEERDAAEILARALARDGVITRLNTTVVGAHRDGGRKWVDVRQDDRRESFEADEILLSTGRIPDFGALDLDVAGVSIGPQGIEIDDFLCSSNADVYAAGDVCLAYKYTNIAEASARLAVRNAFGARDAASSRHGSIPRCTFCDPEIAHIGLHARDARRRGIPVTTYTVMMQDVDRAITEGHDEGFVKILVKDGTDEMLGATIVATRAGEMINEMSVIMSAGIGMRQLAGILHSYPTQTGAIALAAQAFARKEEVPY